MSLYSPLDATRKEIRCLRLVQNPTERDEIECELLVVSLSDSPRYHALSYTWGDPKTIRPITVNGHKVEVTTNLFAALSTLGRNDAELDMLWVDAICINQTDVRDKNQQLPMMPDIYRLATRTQIWLGEASNDSDVAFEMIIKWFRYQEEAEKIIRREKEDNTFQIRAQGIKTDPSHNPLFAALTPEKIPALFDEAGLAAWKRLLMRPYWNRLWVTQEVALSHRPVINCGARRLDFPDFMAAMWLLEHAEDFFTTELVRNEQIASLVTMRSLGGAPLLMGLHWQYSGADDAPQRYTLAELLHRALGRASSNPLDRVYALLGLAKPEAWTFPIDYSITPSRLFTSVMSHFLTSNPGDLDILCAAPASRIDLDVPSWVSDFAAPIRGGLPEWRQYWRANPHHHAADAKLVSLDKLQLTVIPLHQVEETSTYDGDEMSSLRTWIALALSKGITHPSCVPMLRAFLDTVWFLGDRAQEEEMAYSRHLSGFMITLGNLLISQDSGTKMTSAEVSKLFTSDETEAFRAQGAPLAVVMFAAWLKGPPFALETVTMEAALDLILGERGAQGRVPWPEDDTPFRSDKGLGFTIYRFLLLYRSRATGFFTCTDGYIGCGPSMLRKGDVVCVVPGCSAPLAFRPVESSTLTGGEELIRDGGEYRLLGSVSGFKLIDRNMLGDGGRVRSIGRILVL